MVGTPVVHGGEILFEGGSLFLGGLFGGGGGGALTVGVRMTVRVRVRIRA